MPMTITFNIYDQDYICVKEDCCLYPDAQFSEEFTVTKIDNRTQHRCEVLFATDTNYDIVWVMAGYYDEHDTFVPEFFCWLKDTCRSIYNIWLKVANSYGLGLSYSHLDFYEFKERNNNRTERRLD